MLGFEEEPNTTGENYDRLKFNAKDGVWIRKYWNGSEAVEEVIDSNFDVVADLSEGGVRVGWANFATGGKPSIIDVPIGNQLPQKPDDDHKKYFNVKLYNKEFGVINWGSNALSVLNWFDKVHDAYVKKTDKKELLPLLSFKGVSEPQSFGKATVKLPKGRFTKWVERPEAMIDYNKPNNTVKSDDTTEVKPEPKVSREDLDTLSEDFDSDF